MAAPTPDTSGRDDKNKTKKKRRDEKCCSRSCASRISSEYVRDIAAPLRITFFGGNEDADAFIASSTIDVAYTIAHKRTRPEDEVANAVCDGTTKPESVSFVSVNCIRRNEPKYVCSRVEQFAAEKFVATDFVRGDKRSTSYFCTLYEEYRMCVRTPEN
ncbi:hypothetical protein MRX96_035998 [Rhipicephalus microplus]